MSAPDRLIKSVSGFLPKPEHLSHAGRSATGERGLPQIAMAARLRSENAEAVLGVVEGDPLDEAGEH